MAIPRMESVCLADLVNLPDGVPSRIHKRAAFFGDLARFASSTAGDCARLVPVCCPRRPGHKPCSGLLVVIRDEDSPRIEFQCPKCRSGGVISGWEDTDADLRSFETGLVEEPFGVPISVEAHAALRDVARADPVLVPLAYEAEVSDDGQALLFVNPEDSLRLGAALVCHAVQADTSRAKDLLTKIAGELAAVADEVAEEVDFIGPDGATAMQIGLLAGGIEELLMSAPARERSAHPLRLVRDDRDEPRTYQVKVTLRDVRPPVWRRLLVPADIALPALHDVLQVAMGWGECHLHLFRVGNRCFAPPGDWDPVGEDSRGVTLADLAPGKGARVIYEYDFGDGWTHDILVEVVKDEPCAPVRCIKGKRRCPPEDCGGPWGYTELLEALADPKHERHEELSEWIDADLDPEEFDATMVDRRLGLLTDGR